MMLTEQEFLKAVFEGNLNIVKRGIEKGFDVNLVAKNGMSLLVLTIWEKGNAHVAEYLLDNGADMNYRQPSTGWNALVYAAVNGHVEALNMLFDRGAVIDDAAGDWKGLMFAVTFRNHLTAQIMLERGADVNMRDEEGRTPLMRAARNSDIPMVKMLLEFNPDVNAADREGMTPLMYAAQRAKVENVEMLIEAGADPFATNNEGESALDFAQQKNRKKMVNVLESRMALE